MTTPNPITYRFAERPDASRLATFQVKAWSDNYRKFLPSWSIQAVTVEERFEVWRLILGGLRRFHETRVLMAERSGELIAFGATGRQRSDRMKALGYDHEVGALYVRRDLQRCGLGRRMLRRLFKDLSEHGAARATVSVIRANLAGQQFLAHLGGKVLDGGQDASGHILDDMVYGFSSLNIPLRPVGLADLGLPRRAERVSLPDPVVPSGPRA